MWAVPRYAIRSAFFCFKESCWCGVNQSWSFVQRYFIHRVLLNKKYALRWTVIDAVVDHFLSFKCDSRQLPVLWHQSLLTFVQRYKEDLSIPQRESLFGLAAFHSHHTITAEVSNYIFFSISIVFFTTGIVCFIFYPIFKHVVYFSKYSCIELASY